LKMIGDHGQVNFIRALKELPDFNKAHEVLFVSGADDSLASLYALKKKISTVILRPDVFDSLQFCDSVPKGLIYHPTDPNTGVPPPDDDDEYEDDDDDDGFMLEEDNDLPMSELLVQHEKFLRSLRDGPDLGSKERRELRKKQEKQREKRLQRQQRERQQREQQLRQQQQQQQRQQQRQQQQQQQQQPQQQQQQQLQSPPFRRSSSLDSARSFVLDDLNESTEGSDYDYPTVGSYEELAAKTEERDLNRDLKAEAKEEKRRRREDKAAAAARVLGKRRGF